MGGTRRQPDSVAGGAAGSVQEAARPYRRRRRHIPLQPGYRQFLLYVPECCGDMEKPATGHPVAHFPVVILGVSRLTPCSHAVVFAFIPQAAVASPMGMDDAGGAHRRLCWASQPFSITSCCSPHSALWAPSRAGWGLIIGLISWSALSGLGGDPGSELFQAPGGE